MKKMLLKLKIPLLLIFSGILSGLPLIYPELGALQWVSMIPMGMALITLAEGKKARLLGAYGLGMIFYTCYYTMVFHWLLYLHPLNFSEISNEASLAIAMLGCFGVAFLQALFSAVGFVVFVAAARTKPVRRVPYLMPVLMGAIWAVAEWWQTIGWWGMPWGRIAIGQVSFSIFVRSASLFGPYFISFIIVAFNLFLALAIMKKGLKRIAIVASFSLLALNLALGTAVTVSYAVSSYFESDRTVTVAAAQGNIPSGHGLNDGNASKLSIYRELTELAASEGAEMIVWSETAIPFDMLANKYMTDQVRQIAVENDITILVSAFTKDEESGMRYNSLYVINSDGEVGEEVYHKQMLAPFGEYVPLRDVFVAIFPPLGDINMLKSDLKAGEECVVLDSEYGKVGCGICFDSIYENVTLGATNNGAEIIVMSTNFSWFRDSRALNMQNAHCRLRAIENGKYLVCSANTGISSIIDPLGNVIDEVGVLEDGYILSEVEMRDGATLYSLIGNTFVYICMSVPVLLLGAEIFVNINKKKRSAIV